MVVRRTNTCSSCIYLIKVTLPVIIKDIFTKFCKWTLSIYKLLNIRISSYITSISTSRSVLGDFPLWLNKEDEFLYY